MGRRAFTCRPVSKTSNSASWSSSARRPEGKKELLGFTDGARESAQDWGELLLDLKNRGLVIAPELAVADGASAPLASIWISVLSRR